MRLACVLVAGFAIACGSSSSGNPDGGDDDGSGDDGGGANPSTVKLTLTNRPMNASQFSFFVAYQDGSAPWKVAPAPSGDTYAFEIAAPVYGVAYGCVGNVLGTTTTQVRSVTTAHFAIGERTELTLDVPARCSDRNTGNVTLSGTVTNRPFDGGLLVVQYGSRTAFVGSQTGQFSLSTPVGTRDLIITHVVPEGNGEFFVQNALVLRDVAITGATTRTFDFDAAEPTVYYPVDVSDPSLMARVLATTNLYTANGTSVGLVRESIDWETQSLATMQMRTTDVYDQSISVTYPGSSLAVTNATNAPAAQTWVAPKALGTVESIVITKTPYPTVQTGWPAYASTVGYVWNAQQQLSGTQCGGNVACTVVWAALVSPGVTGANPAYRMPDLSTVTGFSQAFALVGGTPIVGGVTAQTSSVGAGDFPPGIPQHGTKRQFARADYAVTP